MSDYQSDCIHLKACRRLCKLWREKYYGMNIARKCDSLCSAYESIDDFKSNHSLYEYDDVQSALHRANNDGVNGYTDIMLEDYL